MLTQQIEREVRQYTSHVKEAFIILKNKKSSDESCMNQLRQSAEAFMKILILKNEGDEDGMNTITTGGTSGRSMMFKDLYWYCNNNRFFPVWGIQQRINDFHEACNTHSHDSNQILDESNKQKQQYGILLCKAQSFYLTRELFDFLGEDIPSEFVSIYDINDLSELDRLIDSQWDALRDFVDDFSGSDAYVLISPSDTSCFSSQQLSSLSRLSWSFVIDFNPDTQISGLYSSFPEIKDRVHNITLDNKHNFQLGDGCNGNINWLHAYGLNTLPSTHPSKYSDWLNRLHYPTFIANVLAKFVSAHASRLCVVYLLDEIKYLKQIISAIISNETLQNDTIKIAVVNQTTDEEEIRSISEDYGCNEIGGIIIDNFSIDISKLLFHVENTFPPELNTSSSILVPCRNQDNTYGICDISSLHSKLLSEGIEIIHQNIAIIENKNISEPIPPFFLGYTISWTEISKEYYVRRDIMEDFRNKVVTLAGLMGKNERINTFEVYSLPGAGSTTLTRVLAYELRTKYPILLLHRYQTRATHDALSALMQRICRPMICFVESSEVDNVAFTELCHECTKSNMTIMFVHVKRTLKKRAAIMQSSYNKRIYLSDHLYSIDEHQRFNGVLERYCQNKNTISLLQQSEPSKCEVIDYSMSISDKDYEIGKLREYVNVYMEKLSPEELLFVVYVSFVYHYSQKSISECYLRSLFDNKKVETHSDNLRYIKKLLISDSDKWRPRYPRFAHAVLSQHLGKGTTNWEFNLPLFCETFIDTISLNQPEITEELEDVVKTIFLKHENEDRLGYDEEWTEQFHQDKFSDLINSLRFFPNEQKRILKKLAETWPSESHFWGHLARFVYENADNESDFDEAEDYISRAFDNGVQDYNLEHMAGMYYRRRIEYYKRNNADFTDKKILCYIGSAREHFQYSREINPVNIHAYVSEIQTLETAIEYAKTNFQYTSYDSFFADEKNYIFIEFYANLRELMAEAQILLSQMESDGVSKKYILSRNVLGACESKSFSYIEDYRNAVTKYAQLITNAPTPQKPRFRRLYIDALLLSKVRGNSERIADAWDKLNDKEVEDILEKLRQNLLELPSDTFSLRTWFQCIINTDYESDEDRIIVYLEKILSQSADHRMIKLEAAYYLYILNVQHLIRESGLISEGRCKKVRELVDLCSKISYREKIAYLALKHSKDISGIVKAKDLHNTSLADLEIVHGVIKSIESSRQGKITLDCGVDAFFVPKNEFLSGRDETKSVIFNVRFRHDGLEAVNVAFPNQLGKSSKVDNDCTLKDSTFEPLDEEDSISDKTTVIVSSTKDQISSEELQRRVAAYKPKHKVRQLKENDSDKNDNGSDVHVLVGVFDFSGVSSNGKTYRIDKYKGFGSGYTENSFDKGQSVMFEEKVRHSNGEDKYFAINIRPLSDTSC